MNTPAEFARNRANQLLATRNRIDIRLRNAQAESARLHTEEAIAGRPLSTTAAACPCGEIRRYYTYASGPRISERWCCPRCEPQLCAAYTHMARVYPVMEPEPGNEPERMTDEEFAAAVEPVWCREAFTRAYGIIMVLLVALVIVSQLGIALGWWRPF